MTKDEALRLALEALELAHPRFGIATEKHKQAITAIKAALEAKDEPDYKALWQQMCERCDELDKKLAQRTWVELTNEEINKIIGSDRYSELLKAVVQTVQAKLKEKNI